MKLKKPVYRECVVCGKLFPVTAKGNLMMCSDECREERIKEYQRRNTERYGPLHKKPAQDGPSSFFTHQIHSAPIFHNPYPVGGMATRLFLPRVVIL